MTKTATPDLALKLRWYGDKKKWPKGLEDLPALLLEASAALASPPPAVEPVAVHPDDEAVDRFAAAMKEKLAKKRAEGRDGWDQDNKAIGVVLSRLLREHVEKGDPLDVGNLAMMIHQRGETIR